ncbi:MAG: cob(I)yrinic acid a,c-diamide adenosyltransferase [Bacteroidota bacterium]
MKIYTKAGDTGETSLFGGERVPKDALRIEAYGSVDELNSLLGVARAMKPKKKIDAILDLLQHQLFELGADLATPKNAKDDYIPRITAAHVTELEKVIDSLEIKLKPLKVFILPGGSKVASHLHLARTVCRRAERAVVRLSRNENIGTDVVVYLNRLSDLLFVLARFANHSEKHPEIKWTGAQRKTKK